MTENIVAVVTGASRGVGRGIAIALGHQGATVYVAGRTSVSGTQTTPGGVPVPGSIFQTASDVTKAGGKGIAVVCDMADDRQIEVLFEQVRREEGRLNILVNNAAYLSESMFVKPFWTSKIDPATIFDVGLRCHHVATYFAAPLLVESGHGLVVNVSFFSNAKVHDPSFYASKAGLDTLANIYADEFRPFGVSAVSLWPGFTATERLRAAADVDKGVQQLEAAFGFESLEYSGRIIHALYGDPDLPSLSGKTLISAELGERYGIVDADGKVPGSLRAHFGGPPPAFDNQP